MQSQYASPRPAAGVVRDQSNSTRAYAKRQHRHVPTVPVCLIPGLAFINSESGEGCSLEELYAFIIATFIGFDESDDKWKSSFRTTVSKDAKIYMKDQGVGNYKFSDKQAFNLKLEAFCRKRPNINDYGLKDPATWASIINGTRGIPKVEKPKKKALQPPLQQPVQQMTPMYQPQPVVALQQVIFHRMGHQHPQPMPTNASQGYVYPQMVTWENGFNGGLLPMQPVYTADRQLAGYLPQGYFVYLTLMEEERIFDENLEVLFSEEGHYPQENDIQEEMVEEEEVVEQREPKNDFIDEFFPAFPGPEEDVEVVEDDQVAPLIYH